MQNIIRASRYLLGQPGGLRRFLSYWLIVFVLLITIPNIGYIVEVLFNLPILSAGERLGYLISPYANTLGAALEPITFSLLLLTLALALNFLFIRFIRSNQQSGKGRLSSTLVMLVSSHCIACGGSLLAPLVSLVAGSGAYFSSERYVRLQLLTLGLNLVALLIVYRSLYKAAGTILVLRNQLTNTPLGYRVKA